MMTIKFRAWDNTSKDIGGQRMMNWDEIQANDEGGFLPLIEIINNKHNVKLMQYTGLKDKNGKEIYEGDIVIIETSAIRLNGPALVYWSDEGAYWGVKKHLPYMLHRCFTTEVIGNIHESPELLNNG